MLAFTLTPVDDNANLHSITVAQNVKNLKMY